MKKHQKTAAALILSAVVLLTACDGDNKTTGGSKPGGQTEGPQGAVSGGSSGGASGTGVPNIVPTGDVGIWDVLPEIEDTPVSELVYELMAYGVEVIGYTGKATEVKIPDKIEGESVVSVDLEAVEISELIMPDTVQRFSFNKESVKYINCPAEWDPGVNNSGDFMSSAIQAIYIPKSATVIGGFDGVVLENCKNLTTVVIPANVTMIDRNAFYGCESLTSIAIPNGVSVIGAGAFEGCTSLADINIPNSVTKINNGAFFKCESLTSITIPDSVTEIGYQAFYGCTNLTATYKGKSYDYAHINDLDRDINGE